MHTAHRDRCTCRLTWVRYEFEEFSKRAQELCANAIAPDFEKAQPTADLTARHNPASQRISPQGTTDSKWIENKPSLKSYT